MALSPSDLEKLAAAYDLGKDQGHSRIVQDMGREQAARVHRAFDKLTKKIDIFFTDRDPYPTFEALRDDVRSNRRMFVYTGGSDTPLWDEKTNWMARAVHDWDHVQGSYDFSVPGEVGAYRYAAAQAPALARLYLSEIALQAASSALHGGFPSGPQKIVLATPEVMRIADTMRLNGKRRRRAAPVDPKLLRTEDLALRLRPFMTPAEVAVHLGAAHRGKAASTLAAASTSLLSRR